ncbi:MAG: galactokinase [Spirochaetes bacterium]|nr:galactokinase [Spirochaetota bacterium]
MRKTKKNPTVLFEKMYGEQEVSYNIERYKKVRRKYEKAFGQSDGSFFSAPGRIEIGGNHTDHNNGRVLAAAVGIDSVCMAKKTSKKEISLVSEGFGHVARIDISDLEKRKKERGTTQAIVRGIAGRFKERGFSIGGVEGYITSDVPVGSGLSSSASIEVLVASVMNGLYNGGTIDPLEIALAGRYAENSYFEKPCGLMDQLACGTGGIVGIDFEDTDNPIVEKIDFSFTAAGYKAVVVQTGPGHADLTPEYAAVPSEMREAARALGGSVMRDVPLEKLLGRIGKLRGTISDRSILRAYHFCRENTRVKDQQRALDNGDIGLFLDLVNESGNSSARWLQNSYSVRDPHSQGVSLALALSEEFFERANKGACRVHGGGFAGTVLAFVHKNDVKRYIDRMEKVFGENSARELYIRPIGAVRLEEMAGV